MTHGLRRDATALMVMYARYHRDRRNIATHFVGVPMIVFAVQVLLSRSAFDLLGVFMTPATLLWIVASAWYLSRGHLVLGLATTLATGLLTLLAHPAAGGSTSGWLACGLGAFVLGWAIQFVGHYYEGRKPAFVDDLTGGGAVRSPGSRGPGGRSARRHVRCARPAAGTGRARTAPRRR